MARVFVLFFTHPRANQAIDGHCQWDGLGLFLHCGVRNVFFNFKDKAISCNAQTSHIFERCIHTPSN